jgi:hypothetical protein
VFVPKDQEYLECMEVMATREYFGKGASSNRKIIVRIGFPRQRSDDERFECVAEIDDGEEVSSKAMNGADAFEALQLALALIGVELKYLTDYHGGDFVWLQGQRNDLGFPSYPDWRPVFEGAIERFNKD